MLIIGAEPRVVVIIARSLFEHGIPVIVATFEPHKKRIRSRAIRECVCVPNPVEHQEECLEGLCSLIRKHRCDMLIPSSDTALVLVSRNYGRFDSVIHICSPPPHILRRVLEKDLTLIAAKSCGIDVPFTYHIRNQSELKAAEDGLQFPIVGKPKSKNRPHDFKVRYYHDVNALREEFERDHDFGENTILQEYCSGMGVGIETLIDKGNPIAFFQHRRIKEYPITGGVSVLAISEAVDPFLSEQALALLRELEWEGIAMVEFRYEKEKNRSALMEVNGRYYGTLSLSSHAGLDFPFYQWQLMHSVNPRVPDDYRIGVKWRWTAGYIHRLHEIAIQKHEERAFRWIWFVELCGFVKDLLPPSRDALLSAKDPIPAASEFGHVLKLHIIGLVKNTAKKIIPQKILYHIGVRRYLDKAERSMYFKLQILRLLKIRRDNLRGMPDKDFSIVFLCHGNIMRSPMAEAIMRECLNSLKDRTISVCSAGLNAEPGKRADGRAVEVAKEFGISLDNHRAIPVTSDLVDRSDAIFVMDFINEVRLISRYPDARKKSYLLGGVNAKANSDQIEILDPYNDDVDVLRRCYQTIYYHIQNLLPVLSHRSG